MDSRTLLIDPASSSAERTFFRIPQGLKFYASKVRLLNFNLLNNSSQPIYFGPRGIYQIVKKISLLSLAGSEIDRLQNMDLMAIKMLHLQNSSQYSLARLMMQNMCVSVTAPTSSQLELTEAAGKGDATLQQAYIDITFALAYLRSRNICDEGYTLQIEWETDPLVSGIPDGYTFSTYPCLALDECLTGAPVDAGDTFVYTTTVGDRLYIPTVGIPVDSTNLIQVRLNAFFNQYLSNFYYFVDWDPTTITAANPNHLAYSVPLEQMELVIDGRKIMIWKGIDTQAKKLASLTDATGEVCLPGVASSYYGVGHSMPVSTLDRWGLKNPNTDVVMNGVMSYGCIQVQQFVQIDMSVYFSFTSVGGSDAQPAFLVYFSDVLRSYTKSTDTCAFITPPTGLVNNQ
tara:strand:- start:4115 stop:5317 length:1203 start_codon:yes stop_codon:yes gene_type:complete